MNRFFSSFAGRLLLSIIVLVCGAYGLSWLMRPRPLERNRVIHPSGYSVIRPDDWTSDMRHYSGQHKVLDFIMMEPARYLGRSPRLMVERLAGAPDEKTISAGNWSEGEFQKQPAWVNSEKTKKALLRWAVFSRDGQWFEASEVLPGAEVIRSDEWWKFLETFRYPDPNAPPRSSATSPSFSTSMPTTGAATMPFTIEPAE